MTKNDVLLVDLLNVLNRIAPAYRFVSGLENLTQTVITKLLLMLKSYSSETTQVIIVTDTKPYLKSEAVECLKSNRQYDLVIKRIINNVVHRLAQIDIPVLQVVGLESDDLIAFIVMNIDSNISITIYSNDSDLYQLYGYNEKLQLLLTKGDIMTFESMSQRYNIDLQGEDLVEFFVNFHAIKSHNNLPKVKSRCSEKEAIELCCGGISKSMFTVDEYKQLEINKTVTKLPYKGTEILCKLGIEVYNEQVVKFKHQKNEQGGSKFIELLNILKNRTREIL